MTIRTIGQFLFQNCFYIYPILLILPSVLYILIVKPGIRKPKCYVYLCGLVMFAAVFVPMFGMSHELFFIIWLFLIPALLLADAVAWLISAFRKKSIMIGAVMTGITVIISGVLLGNWVSVLAAFIFLVVLFTNSYSFY